MQIKKDTKVMVTYRPELGTGAVLQVAETLGGEYQVDVVFEKNGKRFLETFPRVILRQSLIFLSGIKTVNPIIQQTFS